MEGSIGCFVTGKQFSFSENTNNRIGPEMKIGIEAKNMDVDVQN